MEKIKKFWYNLSRKRGDFMTEIFIKNEYATLTQILKIAGLISTGGEGKKFINFNDVFVNGNLEKRRGKKIYNGDIIEVFNKKIVVKVAK